MLLNSPIDFSIGLQISVSSLLWEFRIHLLLQAKANSSSSYTGSCGVFEATSISTKELASTAVRNILTHGSPWQLAIAGEAGWLFCRSKSPKKMEKPGRGHSTATPRNQMADATLTLHPGHTTEVSPSSNIWSNWYPKFLNTTVQLVVTR